MEEANFDTKLTRGDKVGLGFALLLPLLIMAAVVSVVSFFCGCKFDENIGSKTVVGNHRVLPKLCTGDSNAELDIYETVEGAVITTRKDSRVKVDFDNCYTNDICCGLWRWWGRMKLNVEVEPLQVDGVGSNFPADASEPPDDEASTD